MPDRDLAIPILPCRSATDTVNFYRSLGFEGAAHEFDANYVILRRGDVEVHFFVHTALDPATSSAGCYIRVSDVESWYRDCSNVGLSRSGIPRLDILENKPWGLREFALVDSDGNLLRVGQVLKA